MKPHVVKLERLFQAAKSARAVTAEPMPEHLKNRILAQWSGHSLSPLPSAMELLQALRLVSRLGLGLACAVMLACLAWSYPDLTREPDTDVEAFTIRAHLEMQL